LIKGEELLLLSFTKRRNLNYLTSLLWGDATKINSSGERQRQTMP